MRNQFNSWAFLGQRKFVNLSVEEIYEVVAKKIWAEYWKTDSACIKLWVTVLKGDHSEWFQLSLAVLQYVWYRHWGYLKDDWYFSGNSFQRKKKIEECIYGNDYNRQWNLSWGIKEVNRVGDLSQGKDDRIHRY